MVNVYQNPVIWTFFESILQKLLSCLYCTTRTFTSAHDNLTKANLNYPKGSSLHELCDFLTSHNTDTLPQLMKGGLSDYNETIYSYKLLLFVTTDRKKNEY